MEWQQLLTNVDLIQTGLLINGEWLSSERKSMAVNNPATGAIIANIALATPGDLANAVTTARVAMAQWAKLAAKERSQVLYRWYQLLIANLEDLATILTVEQGKPLAEARAEIVYGASYIEWYAEEAKRNYGETIPANNSKQRILIQHEPVGVCAAITPWNFPNAMLARKVAPALAAGCAMLAKPASQTPLSANALAYLALAAGVPPGVFNVVHGQSGLIGEFFCNNSTIRKLSFTGSTEVGIWLYQNCANSMKKLALELGGNAPLIVFADADLKSAVAGIMNSKFRNAGQTCVCSNRILVHNSIRHQLINLLQQQMQNLQLGNGLNDGVSIGPLIDDKAIIHANSLVADALEQGAHLICGGRVDEIMGGLFYQPTLIDCPTSNIRLFKEEIFAPIVAVYSFNSEEEAIEMANNTPYGLASYFFSQDLKRVYRLAEALEYGIVGVNTGVVSAENVPFGGVKMSGLGKEGGRYGLQEYLQTKYIVMELEP